MLGLVNHSNDLYDFFNYSGIPPLSTMRWPSCFFCHLSINLLAFESFINQSQDAVWQLGLEENHSSISFSQIFLLFFLPLFVGRLEGFISICFLYTACFHHLNTYRQSCSFLRRSRGRYFQSKIYFLKCWLS